MNELHVYLVSGGTGLTGQQVLRACMAQFPNQTVHVHLKCAIRTAEAAQEVVTEVHKIQGIICHSLVDPAMRHSLIASALNAGIPCIDLLGPTLAVMAERLESQPVGQAGLLYELHKEQLDRMDAVDFTMAHDDGRRLYDLDRAQVVVVGLSRVSKSVTCFYLACRGVRAANVPIVLSTAIPEELLRLEPSKVFGLAMNASHLASIRKTRLDRIAGRHEVPEYADVRQVSREVRQADELFVRHGWTRIDVSYKATEEVAAQIIDALHNRTVKEPNVGIKTR